jgi:hypothetical protein
MWARTSAGTIYREGEFLAPKINAVGIVKYFVKTEPKTSAILG